MARDRYYVFLATETLELEADLVRIENNYDLKIEGQQPTVCFYRGLNPTHDHLVGEFVYKNISGYCKASEVKLISLRRLNQ